MITSWFFLLENPLPLKFLVLGGGVGGEGAEVPILCYGRGDFSDCYIP